MEPHALDPASPGRQVSRVRWGGPLRVRSAKHAVARCSTWSSASGWRRSSSSRACSRPRTGTTRCNLAANEYPVSWLDPVAAAWLGRRHRAGRLHAARAGPARPARLPLPMLILSLVIQFNYLAFDTHLFWAALFGWYVVLRRGAALARPLACARAGRQCAAARGCRSAARTGSSPTGWAPVYVLVLRLWLAPRCWLRRAPRSCGHDPPDWRRRCCRFGPQRISPAVAAGSRCGAARVGLATRPIAAGAACRAAGGADGRPAPVGRLVLDADASRCSPCAGPGRLSLDALIKRCARARVPAARGQACLLAATGCRAS